MKRKRNSAALWRRVAIIALCAGILLLLLYGGTLIIEQRRRATEQKIRDLYYGGKIGLLTDLTKLRPSVSGCAGGVFLSHSGRN